MNNIRYHSTRPLNDKTFFVGDDLVDFELDAPADRSLVAGSIEISGVVKVYENTRPADGVANRLVEASAGKAYINKDVGAHALFASMSCSTINQGSVEQISVAYPRFVGMMGALSKADQDKNAVDSVLEWKFPDNVRSDNYLRQGAIIGNGNTINVDPTFNIKPMIVFNRSDSNIPFAKTGKMRISVNLETDEKALVNRITKGGVTDLTYAIEQLRCRYRSVPTPQGAMGASILAEKVVPLKATINSSLSTIALNVPTQAASGCSISFQATANEGLKDLDNNQQEKINISGLQFFYNNANTYLNYKLDHLSEIVLRGLKSYSPSNDEASNSVNEDNIASNENFIVGTDFDGVVSLQDETFSVQVESDVAVNTNVYLYFHSMLNL